MEPEFPNIQYAGVSYGFSIDFEDSTFLRNNYPGIYTLFKEKLISAVVVTPEKEVVFDLNSSTFDNDLRYPEFGLHEFLLSRDDVKILNKYYVHIEDSNSFGAWTYYIIWHEKG